MQSTLHRLVHGSTDAARNGLSRSSSDASSPRRWGKSCPLDIYCRVLIAVVVGLALWAIPLAHGQRQTFQNVTADVTPLARREEAINLLQRLPIAVALVGEHRSEGAKCSVGETPRQAVVTDHAAHVQIFDADCVEAAHKVGCDLVHVIRPGISYVSVNLGDSHTGMLSPPATLDSPCEHSLCSRQLSLPLFTVAHVRDSLTVREGSETRDSEVNPDHSASLRQSLEGFVEAKGHEITSNAVLDYRGGSGATAELSAPTNLQLADLGNGQGLVQRLKLEAGSRVLGGLLPTLFLERWIPCAVLEEIAEAPLQVPQGLLRRDARDLVQPSVVFRSLERSQCGARSVVVDRFAAPVTVSAKSKRVVVDKAAGSEGSSEQVFLLDGGIGAKPVTDLAHKSRMALVKLVVKPSQERRFLHQLKQVVSTPKI